MLIIGGTGDLAMRHLLPALAELGSRGELPDGFALTLADVDPLTTRRCREVASAALDAAKVTRAVRRSLVSRIGYVQADVRDAEALCGVLSAAPTLVYLALPAELVLAAVRALRRAGLERSSRVILDKPFGLSRASARSLNAELRRLVDAPGAFRVDHFLYHAVVQDLVRSRVGSDSFAAFDGLPLLSVEIAWDETRPAEPSRSGYSGALRDMVQSHLLQLVAVMTMDPPPALTRDELARRRLDALRRISVWDGGNPSTGAARARLRSRPGRGPAAGEGFETYVALSLAIDARRWKHVPFQLRAAKGVALSRRSIDIRFACARPSGEPSYVRLDVLDGRVSAGIVESTPSYEQQLAVAADTASVRLLRAAMTGDDTFTLLPEEPEECWRIVEPVIAAWENAAPMPEYPLGAPADGITGRQSGAAR